MIMSTIFISVKIGEIGSADFDRVKEKLEALLEFANRHSTEAEIEGIAPKSDSIVDDTNIAVNIENVGH